jgi:26S proteasome non-ATPase regulatory subunit 10
MELAAEKAREGDAAYFAGLQADEMARLCAPRSRDEDGRTLLHSAAVGGNLELLRTVADRGGAAAVNAQDEEVRLRGERAVPAQRSPPPTPANG